MFVDIEELLQLAFDSRRRFSEMQETLVNHKREVWRGSHILPSFLPSFENWRSFPAPREIADIRNRPSGIIQSPSHTPRQTVTG